MAAQGMQNQGQIQSPPAAQPQQNSQPETAKMEQSPEATRQATDAKIPFSFVNPASAHADMNQIIRSINGLNSQVVGQSLNNILPDGILPQRTPQTQSIFTSLNLRAPPQPTQSPPPTYSNAPNPPRKLLEEQISQNSKAEND